MAGDDEEYANNLPHNNSLRNGYLNDKKKNSEDEFEASLKNKFSLLK